VGDGVADAPAGAGDDGDLVQQRLVSHAINMECDG